MKSKKINIITVLLTLLSLTSNAFNNSSDYESCLVEEMLQDQIALKYFEIGLAKGLTAKVNAMHYDELSAMEASSKIANLNEKFKITGDTKYKDEIALLLGYENNETIIELNTALIERRTLFIEKYEDKIKKLNDVDDFTNLLTDEFMDESKMSVRSCVLVQLRAMGICAGIAAASRSAFALCMIGPVMSDLVVAGASEGLGAIAIPEEIVFETGICKWVTTGALQWGGIGSGCVITLITGISTCL